jgi:hypothetical protein
LRRAELLGLRWEDIEYLNPDLGVMVVQRRVNYLGKGINRLKRDGLKNGDPFKRVHIGSLMLDVLRMRWVHQLGQRRAALEPGQRRWRGVDYEPNTRTGFIFTNPTDGTPMNPRSADKAFAAIRIGLAWTSSASTPCVTHSRHCSERAAPATAWR